MRIVMVTGSLSRRAGGLFWSVRRLSQTLARAGAEVHVLGLRDIDTDCDLSAWAPLVPEVFDCVGPARLGYAPAIRRAISRLKPDIVHQHGIWQAFSLATIRWSKQAQPVVISPRGMMDPWAIANSQWKKRLVWYCYERINMQRAACLHALTASEASAIRSVLPDTAIATIPNGMDLAALNRDRARPAEGRPRLLFISRIHPKKGLMEFLEHWADVRPRLRRPWMLRIAGPDEVGHLQALRARVEALGLGADVTFVGPVYGEAKARELAESEAFVLPSKSEGLPMAVLEAWAAGLPVFMTRACNLPEGFEAGAAIELTGDPMRLVNGLNRNDLPNVGARGQALVAARFDWNSIAAQMMAVYAWCLGNDEQPDRVVTA